MHNSAQTAVCHGQPPVGSLEDRAAQGPGAFDGDKKFNESSRGFQETPAQRGVTSAAISSWPGPFGPVPGSILVAPIPVDSIGVQPGLDDGALWWCLGCSVADDRGGASRAPRRLGALPLAPATTRSPRLLDPCVTVQSCKPRNVQCMEGRHFSISGRWPRLTRFGAASALTTCMAPRQQITGSPWAAVSDMVFCKDHVIVCQSVLAG